MRGVVVTPGVGEPASEGFTSVNPEASAGAHTAIDLDAVLQGVERRALRMAQIATGHRDEALDLVQDAMLRLVEHYAEADARDWPALFFRILGNAIHDWRRRGGVRKRFGLWLGGNQPVSAVDATEDWLSTVPDGGQGPLELLRDRQALQALVAALRALPERQQQCFLLRAWEGLDVSATALAMGVSEGSVKTHYFRAIQRLKSALGGHWP